MSRCSVSRVCSSPKKRTIPSATTVPIPYTAVSSSTDASRSWSAARRVQSASVSPSARGSSRRQPGREVDRRLLPDVADAEPVEDPASGRRRAASIDAVEVLRALLRQAVEAGERLGVEAEDVGRLLHEVALDELEHDLEAEPVDVDAATSAEVQQAADALRRAVRVRAAQ